MSSGADKNVPTRDERAALRTARREAISEPTVTSSTPCESTSSSSNTNAASSQQSTDPMSTTAAQATTSSATGAALLTNTSEDHNGSFNSGNRQSGSSGDRHQHKQRSNQHIRFHEIDQDVNTHAVDAGEYAAFCKYRDMLDNEVLAIENGGCFNSGPHASIGLCGSSVRFLVDKGSPINVIDERTYAELESKPRLEACTGSFYGVGSDKPIELLGQFTTIINFRGLRRLHRRARHIAQPAVFYGGNEARHREDLRRAEQQRTEHRVTIGGPATTSICIFIAPTQPRRAQVSVPERVQH